MQIFEFLALDGEFHISAEEAQKLNLNLSEIPASDIPKDKRDQVLDYLIAALNMDSVEPNSKHQIEKLVSDFQDMR